MFLTPISWLMFLRVAKHSVACLMGPRPSSLHGRVVGPAAFGGAAAVPRSSLTSGSYQRGDRGGGPARGWESEEEDPEKGRQMEGTRDRVRQSDKGEEDKRCLTGRSSVAEGIRKAR